MIPFYFLVIVAVKPDTEALTVAAQLPERAPPRQLQHRLERRRARPLAREQPDHHRRERPRADRDRLDLRVRDRAPAREDEHGALLPVRARDHPPVPARPRADVRGDARLRPRRLVPRDHPALHRDLDAVRGLPLHGLRAGAAEGVRGGVARRRRVVAADVPASRVPAPAAGHRHRRDLHRADHLERLLPLADLPQRHGQDAAAGRRVHVRRRVRVAVEPDLRRRDRLARCRS